MKDINKRTWKRRVWLCAYQWGGGGDDGNARAHCQLLHPVCTFDHLPLLDDSFDIVALQEQKGQLHMQCSLVEVTSSLVRSISKVRALLPTNDRV
jgi:hypothetical protein